jgi:Fe-S-cluster-containing hydrogenase component 2
MAMVYINAAACTSCGECVAICPSGAIQLMDSVAQIDQGLCQGCEACVSTCPHQAILVVQKSRQKSLIVRPPAPVAASAPFRPGLWPALSAVLVFIGQEIVPRAAGALLEAWDQRQARQNSVTAAWKDVADAGYNPRGGGRHWRWRGGNPKRR